MPRKRASRVYWRERGGVRRAYGDFRDLGGGREALIPRGRSTATTDPDVAAHLADKRVKQLEGQHRGHTLLGVERRATLARFAEHHLVEKKRAGRVTEGWLGRAEMHLQHAVNFLGADRELTSITVRDVQRFEAHLQTLDNGRGGKLGPGSRRKYLNSLSNLFRRAQAEACVLPGYNPVAATMEKPIDRPQEARWLEIHDAALYLEAARLYRPKEPHENLMVPMRCAYPLVATFLLTGGRRAEVLGLRVSDVSFDRCTVTFRPNEQRKRLKTAGSHRAVRLWPQLEEILREYVFGSDAPPAEDALLFPSVRKPGEMITDTRKLLDNIAARASFSAGEIRTRIFRHTYTAARLQTLDNDYPVSPWTVARELGHGGRSLVDRVYGHLGDVRHRSEVVEYRVQQHRAVLGDRLKELTLTVE